MKRRLLIAGAVALLGTAAIAVAANDHFQVVPQNFDPAHTFLVESTWLDGIGCPTNANIATYPATKPTGTYTDPACATGDSTDHHNQGLLLVKTGPTANNAAAQAQITGLPKRTTIHELGYDLRKPGADNTDPRGSQCDAQAPIFYIVTSSGAAYAIACQSPPPTSQTAGNGWIRLRWGSSTGPLYAYPQDTTPCANPGTGTNAGQCDISSLTVKSITLEMYSGQDTPPNNFGLSVVDNIDVNGVLVGHGPGRQNCDDDSHGNDRDDCRDNGDHGDRH